MLVPRGQGHQIPVGLELKKAVSHPACVLGTKLGPSPEHYVLLTSQSCRLLLSLFPQLFHLLQCCACWVTHQTKSSRREGRQSHSHPYLTVKAEWTESGKPPSKWYCPWPCQRRHSELFFSTPFPLQGLFQMPFLLTRPPVNFQYTQVYCVSVCELTYFWGRVLPRLSGNPQQSFCLGFLNAETTGESHHTKLDLGFTTSVFSRQGGTL